MLLTLLRNAGQRPVDSSFDLTGFPIVILIGDFTQTEKTEFLLEGHGVKLTQSTGIITEIGSYQYDGGDKLSRTILVHPGSFLIVGNPVEFEKIVLDTGQKSSLYGVRNAIVDFFVPNSEMEQDAKTGNYRTGIDEIRYDLYLRKAINDQRRNYPGVDRLASTYDGYAVYPSELDARIKSGTKGRLKFGESENYHDCVVRDVRYQFSSFGTIGGALSSALGDSLLLESSWQN